MTQAAVRPRLSFEEYTALDPTDLPEGNYELVNGVIVEMGAESPQNVLIASFLFVMLLKFVPYYLLHRGTEIAVSSTEVTTRYPDLLVLTEAGLATLIEQPRSLITPEMPAPALVVEVVSPGEEKSDNYKRDYIHKRDEYAKRGIPEYWLVDPLRSVVLVLSLVDSTYDATEFKGDDRLVSPTFPDLNLTAHQILIAGEASP